MAKVTMPQLGESVAEGTIGKWLKQPGDTVAKYEPLLEVITDKVNAEVPSPFEGVLKEILAEEGATVPNNAEIAIIETADEAGADAPPPVATEKEGGPEAEGTVEVEPRDPATATPAKGPAGSDESPATDDAAAQPAAKQDAPDSRRSRAGRDRTHGRRRPKGDGSSRHSSATRQRPGPVRERRRRRPDDAGRSSPPPRARIERGPDRRHRRRRPHHPRRRPRRGRVIRTGGTAPAAATTASNGAGATTAPTAPTAPAAPTASPVRGPAGGGIEFPEGTDEVLLPMTQMRKGIAAQMTRALLVPHAYVHMEVDATALVKAREKAKREYQAREGISLSYVPFVIKATVAGAPPVPDVQRPLDRARAAGQAPDPHGRRGGGRRRPAGPGRP